MTKKLLLKSLFLLLCVMVGTSNVWAQSDKSATYTSNVTLSTSGGTSASTAKVKVTGTTEYDAIKAGTSKIAGAVKITVPSGAKYLHLHIAGWNGESVTISVTPNTNIDNKSISLTADAGISGSGTTYTLSAPAKATTDYYKVITFTNALTANTDFTFTASSGKRFVIWGVNSEEESSAYTVTYNANGADSGTVPTDATEYASGATVTVLGNTGSLVKTGYTFDGWNTQANGEGTNYTAGNTFTISANTTLYAKWTDPRATTEVNIDDSGITNTNKFVSTDAGSLSASVTYGSPATAIPAATVTWSSSEESVATINSTTGAITLVGAGTTTITASYAGDESYKASSNTYELTVTNENPNLSTIWSEDFSGYSADDVPTGGTYSYACVNGGSNTKIYAANLAEGTSPELLVGKNNGTFTATIPLITSTYGYSGDLILTYKTNATALNVKTTTDGITVDGEAKKGDGVSFNTKDTHTITFKGVTSSTENITIVFTATSGSNVRLDDILLQGEKVALSKVATPSISPASGAVASGTEVTITCATDDASIYFTTDGATPTSSSTLYDPANKPTITTATTIKAIAVKGGLTDSEVASASYTIAEPCATPTFSVVAGEVAKGTTVTISTETDGATIYYTTNGTTPTTSSTVYSSAITINSAVTIKAIAAKEGHANSEVASASYTIIDYATLPFSFNNGKSSIASTTGLTESGLGSDYSSAPKLKFDSTNDYLILKVNEVPDELKFDIKGNGFSGGTFKVQYSADGSAYSDLETYTSLDDTQTETLAIPATTHYIKWIYTSKSSGNVALGNIKLYACESVAISDAGWATYCSSKALDFTDVTGLTAYTASKDGDVVKFNKVTGKVPANEGLLVKGATTNIPVCASASAIENLLVGVTVNTNKDANTIFVLKNGANGIGFYKNTNAFTVRANSAYLDATDVAGARTFIALDDEETTNIDLTPVFSKGEAVVYDLQGRRVAQPTKGLYIVNGKKVVIK